MTYTTRSEIQAVIDDTCTKLLGCVPSGITFRFSGRMSSTMGYAYYVSRELKFSRALWTKASPDERYQTIVHEVCHIIAFMRAGAAGKGHGRVWKALMRQAGVKPTRCHRVPVVRRKQRGSLDVVCACPGKVHTLSTRTANRYRAGIANLRCRTCMQPVHVTPEVLKRDVFKHGISPMAQAAACLPEHN